MIQRLLAWLRRALRRPAASFIYHPSYARTVAGVPLDPAQPDEILAFLLAQRLIRRRDIVRPFPARLEHLLRVHTAAYLESLQDAATLSGIFGVPVADDAVAEILDAQRLIVGGTILATRLALATGRIVINLRGGLHHAAPERGMGFCVFNDVAVAIARLRARRFALPVLVIDLDLHDGNGTRAAFAHDPSVHTFSIHNQTWDDGPALATTRIALGSGVTDATYLAALQDALPPVIRAHRPGLVVYVAGSDPAADDALGDWRITPTGMLRRDQFVVDAVRGNAGERGLPLVIVPGGGYGSGAWRYAARSFAWLLCGRVLEPPDDMTLVLSRFRPIAQEIAENDLAPGRGVARAADDWRLTEADLPGSPVGEAGGHRVLGRYSRHAFELLLERLGILERLRDRGFRHPVLDVECIHGRGDTIRVWGDPGRRELLIELRVARDHTVVTGMEVLYVEWLLLQNPRTPFTGRLTPLPGQEHPGLGLLAELVGLLVVVCEALGLDGIVFEPAHYYTAALGQHHLRFLRPEDQARVEALHAAVADLSLAEAERAIAAGHVVNAAGEPVRWQPAPMVYAVSERLRRLVAGPRYEDARAQARAKLAFQAQPTATHSAPP